MRVRARFSLLAITALTGLALPLLPVTSAVATPPITVTVTPSTSLNDGETVSVDVTNIPDGVSYVQLNQCDNSVAYSGNTTCKDVGPSAVPVSNNAIQEQSYSVRYGTLQAGNPSSRSCTTANNGNCVIAVFGNGDSSTPIGTAVITFATPPPPSVSVSPATTGLFDGDTVQVAASNIPSSYNQVSIAECNASWAQSSNAGSYANYAPCAIVQYVNVSNHSASTPLSIVTGELKQGQTNPACSNANNGQCVVAVLGQIGNGQPTVLASQAISFRAPHTAPGTEDVSPNTGLHGGSTVTVSTPDGDMPETISSVQIMQCNTGYATKHGYGDGCASIGDAQISGGTMTPQDVNVDERSTSEGDSWSCDNTTNAAGTCVIGLFSQGQSNPPTLTLRSSLQPISFRNPNSPGTPTIALSDSTGLDQGQTITADLTKLPDTSRTVRLAECNATNPVGANAYDLTCADLQDEVDVTDNAAESDDLTVLDGKIGNGSNGFCDSQTNGDCVVVATTSGQNPVVLASAPITFSNADVPTLTLSAHNALGPVQKLTITVSNAGDGVGSADARLCRITAPNCEDDAYGADGGASLKHHAGSGTIQVNAGIHGPPWQVCDYATNGKCAIFIDLGDRHYKFPIAFKDTYAQSLPHTTASAAKVAKGHAFKVHGFIGADDRSDGLKGADAHLYERANSHTGWKLVKGKAHTSNAAGKVSFSVTGLGHSEEYSVQVPNQKVGGLTLGFGGFDQVTVKKK